MTNNKRYSLPSTPSLAYFECVLDSFPDAILNTIVESTKGAESNFNPYESDRADVVNRIIKHSIRAGFRVFIQSLDIDLSNTLIHIYKPYLEQRYSKAQLESRFLLFKKDIISEIWGALGFDRFLQNLPAEIIHKCCEVLGFREEVDDKESLELALKEELLIIGFCEVLRKQELKHLKSALTSLRDSFKSLFDQYPFFEDSYCVSDYFDSEAFALFFLSFSFPHVRKEFIDYIQHSDSILKKLNSRALKKILALSFTNGQSEELVTSSEQVVLQLLVENGAKQQQENNTEKKEEKQSKKKEKIEEEKEKKSEKKQDEKKKVEKVEKEKKEKTKEESVKVAEPTPSTSSEPSTKTRRKRQSKVVVSSSNDNSEEEEESSKEPTFPSSEGRVKIVKGVTAPEIYTNYTAKEIYDICKIFGIKLAGNSTERTKRIVKFLNDGIIEGKRKRKRASTSGSSSKKSK